MKDYEKKDGDSNALHVDELPYSAWLRASPFRQNVVIRLRSEVIVGSARRKFFKEMRRHQKLW